MPAEVAALRDQSEPFDRCPACGAEPFKSSHMRGMVQRSPRWPWWRRWFFGSKYRGRRDYCAVICNDCEEIVGYESPAQSDVIYELLKELRDA